MFNDDKKTELIGETWVALEQIIIPGGGQSDIWHTLNCKGRFAGEIRIELTYYDTRPREEKPEKRRPSAPVEDGMSQCTKGIGGPRQPRPVKRRPLPADPTDSSYPSPSPHTPLQDTQQRYAESPDDLGANTMSSSDSRYEHLPGNTPRGSSLNDAQLQQQQQQKQHSQSTAMDQSHYHIRSGQPSALDQGIPDHYGKQFANVPDSSLQSRHQYGDSTAYTAEHPEDWQSRPAAQPLQTPHAMAHSHSIPVMNDGQPQQNGPYLQQYPGSSPPKSHSHEENFFHQYPNEDDYDPPQNGVESPTYYEEAPPPPPPVHRNSGSRHSFQTPGQEQIERYASIPATAPLNVRSGRASIAGSPLSYMHGSPSQTGYPKSSSPSHSLPLSHPAPSISSRSSYSQLRNQRSQSPIRDSGQSLPPSLVPGYEPSIADDESERLMYEKRMSARHHYSDPSRPQFPQTPVSSDNHLQLYQQTPASADRQQSHYQQEPAPISQPRPQPRSRDVENVQERRAHRTSAPILQPQPMTPDPRTPLRKSVNPQPGSAPAERRRSEVPFSPDSFDAFNPSIGAAGSVNEPGARYNTPEQAREATRQHERQSKLGDGPIIGNDGRIIDPSDHLPTDTWAPEPEQKAPKKGPQVTMRFRHSPQGAQPMPATRRPAIEHSVSTPVYSHASDEASPRVAARGRLQKKSRAAIAQPASSPSVPTLNTTPRNSPLRASETSYPLQERENYGGYGSSPTYGRPSPGNIPPPVPGKVPIGSGREDWDTDALSEEMRMIDIGVGGGQARQRRNRYGM